MSTQYNIYKYILKFWTSDDQLLTHLAGVRKKVKSNGVAIYEVLLKSLSDH